jgi:hypothetical protein
VRIETDHAYFVLGEIESIAYPASYKIGLGFLATIPNLCHEPHWPGIHYGYVQTAFDLFSRKLTDMLILIPNSIAFRF